jgi:hypothetical protein
MRLKQVAAQKCEDYLRRSLMARVLLVEADGDIRSQLVPALERLGHDVTIFTEVATAWQGEVLDHDFDLYVLGGDLMTYPFSACAVACTSCIRQAHFGTAGREESQ